MKIKRKHLTNFYAALLCALVPACALADADIVVRGGSVNVKQKLIRAPQAGSMDDLNRGLAKYDNGDFKGALVDINKAILKDPLNSQAFFYRGLVRENLGDYVNAISDFEQNRVAAFDPIVLSEKAYCQTNMYELNAAMVSLNRALAQDHASSDAATALSRRAIVKRLLHNLPDAISDCNQALKLVPNDVEARWQRAVTYCSMRKYPDAILDLQFVVQSAPRFANGHYTLAECFRVTGRSGDAISEYKKALALFSEQNDTHGKQSAQTKIAELSSNSRDVSAGKNQPAMKNQPAHQVGMRVGLVLAYSGEWILENGKNKRRIKERGFSVYEGERPLRTSKDGSLTVACVNNTTAICPGNHKIGEPFLLSEVEQVDDWWAQLLPFLSNYGTWIYPANRNLGGTSSLSDAVICEPASGEALVVSDIVANLPDGAYKAEIAESFAGEGVGKNGIKLDIVKRDGAALATKLGKAEAPVLHQGTYTFRVLSGPANSKIDWTLLDPALIEIVDSGRYMSHRTTLQVAMKKTEAWTDPKQVKAKVELIRALIVAQSKAPQSAYPQAFKLDRTN